MKKFWNWYEPNPDQGEGAIRELRIDGAIAEDSWFDDDVTPGIFRDELLAGSGPVTVWINSPGGDCVAASQIYTMLKGYDGEVTIRIDGMAASAASVISMAGDTVEMSPTAVMMIHNPLTAVFGNRSDMKQAIQMLDEVKESIINAYELKTGLPREKISSLMDKETWMSAHKAVELGFADRILGEDASDNAPGYAYSNSVAVNSLVAKLQNHTDNRDEDRVAIQGLYDRLYNL